MKNLFYLIFLFTLISCIGKGEKNYQDLLKVKKGMHITTVDSIMTNNPKLKDKAYWNDTLYVYYYDSHFTASDDLKVIFNRDSLVVDVKYGD